MFFNENQLAFFKKCNLEATEENFHKLQAFYAKAAADKLDDSDLAFVTGGYDPRSNSGYEYQQDISYPDIEEWASQFPTMVLPDPKANNG